MDIILIPGMWLDGSSWDRVVPALERAGHRTHALTLPGMESPATDRTAITLRDHIDAVLGVVDSLDGPVVLVGHSAGGGLAHAVADARPNRITRVVYVGGEPRGTDEGGCPFPAVGGEIPLPDWTDFDDEMVADLDEDQRQTMRAHAIPVPEHVATDPLTLTDDRRYDVPATLITCEYPASMLQHWMDAGEPGAAELAKLRNVEFVDLESGHWPQFTRADDLSAAILAAIR
jgi:pimeloyl-ACP methyl ester carboxylesterase